MVNLPKAKGPWYQFRNETSSDGPAELMIYDVIEEGWGVSPSTFAQQLAQLDADELTVRINSPGGSVYDGIAILNSLRGARQKVTTVVDGLAASAASFIAMAGDEIVVMPNAEMMIHNAWAMAIGDYTDLAKAADDLQRMSANIAAIYADRTGISADFWADQMANETWYSAQEAVDVGLATRVGTPDSATNQPEMASSRWNLAIFNFAGRAKAPAPVIKSPSPSAEVKVHKERKAEMPTLKESLADRLGLDADADDEVFAKAVENALAAKDESDDAPTAPTVEQAQKVAAQNGLVMVDSGALDDLKAKAALGAAARAQQLADADNALVDSAIRDGKIAPARKEHWLNQLAADREGVTPVIEGLPSVFNVDSGVGHSIGGDQSGVTKSPGAKDAWDELNLDKFEEFYTGKKA